MFILFWIVIPIVTYLFVAGILREPFARVSARRCQECKDGKHPVLQTNDYGPDRTMMVRAAEHHGGNGAAQAAFWPVTLPWTLGSMVNDPERAKDKVNKATVRRQEEIEEAKHQAELARIRADEDAHLTRQLQDK